MILRVFLFLSIFIMLEASGVQNLLVIKATKSTIEAEDLLNTMIQEKQKSKIIKIKNYQLVTIELPQEEHEAILLLTSIKKNYPEAFRFYPPKPYDPNDEISIQEIANSLNTETINTLGFLNRIPKKDLPLWGALILLAFVIVIILAKSYLQRRDIDRLQRRLLVRQEKIAQSISQEQKTMQDKKIKFEKEERK